MTKDENLLCSCELSVASILDVIIGYMLRGGA